MSCDEIRELLEEYALGSLDEDERARVEEHLARCDECRALASEYATALAGLPDALAIASPLPLPASLKERLERAIGAEVGVGQPVVSPKAEGPVPQRSKTARRLIVLAAATLLALTVAATAALSFALDHERTLRERYGDLLDDRELVIEVLDSQDTTRARLKTRLPDSRAYGKIFTNATLPHVVIMAARLPQLPAGQVYRVWLTEGSRTSSPGKLEVNEAGFGLLLFASKEPDPQYDAVRVARQGHEVRRLAGQVLLAWTRGDNE